MLSKKFVLLATCFILTGSEVSLAQKAKRNPSCQEATRLNSQFQKLNNARKAASSETAKMKLMCQMGAVGDAMIAKISSDDSLCGRSSSNVEKLRTSIYQMKSALGNSCGN